MPNEHHIRQVIAAIENDPQHWDQGTYVDTNARCGTTYCMAGWAGKLAGYPDAKLNDLADDGEIDEIAMDFLGLTSDQADELFDFMFQYEPATDEVRHPTLAEFKERVTKVTGVTFEDAA